MRHYQLDRKTYKELLLLYKEILENTGNLFKNYLELDTISKNCASYVYMYKNGYLSFNHTFTFSDTYASVIDYNHDILGGLIATGTGICRNITSFFTDLLNIMGYSCYNLTLDDVERFGNKEKTLLLYTKLFPKLLGTHMINYIKDDNKSIIFDAIDDKDHFPRVVDKGIIKYNYLDNRYIAWFVNDINKGIVMPTLRRQENNVDNLEYEKTMELLNNNKEVLEKFYQYNKDLYYEMYVKIINEMQKELSFYNSFKVKTRYK